MNIKQRKLHKITGVALLLPFAVWSLTGIFFLLRPPYFEAYERIPVKNYPMREALALPANNNWFETRSLQSILGLHVLTRDNSGWHHLRAGSFQAWSFPSKEDLITLLEDAFQFNPTRYGSIVEINENHALTDTGIRVTIDWQTLSITQEGQDSVWIDRLYNLHYLRWTGIAWLDQILGVAGLCLLLYMTYSGTRMVIQTSNERGASDSRIFE